MSKIQTLAFAVCAAAWPVMGSSDDEDWKAVGSLRGVSILVAPDAAYADLAAATFAIPGRLEGDFDARVDSLPSLAEDMDEPVDANGARRLELLYVFDCVSGDIRTVHFHAAFDAEQRRISVSRGYAAVVEHSISTGIRAVSTAETLAERRSFCKMLAPKVAG